MGEESRKESRQGSRQADGSKKRQDRTADRPADLMPTNKFRIRASGDSRSNTIHSLLLSNVRPGCILRQPI